jgi:hypothetical protein
MLFTLFSAALILVKPVSAATPRYDNFPSYLGEFTGDYDWQTVLNPPASSNAYITYTEYRTTYCTASATANDCLSAANDKKIRFDTADELYRFSVDVSFNPTYIYPTGNPTEDVKLSHEKRQALLLLNYVLGNDIDYAVMKAKTFIPIGYWFTDVFNNSYKTVFKGTFDGQGFRIYNLYVAGYDYMTYEQDLEGNSVDVATAPYYSMFTFNEGTITRLGLVNPTLEMLNVHIDINSTANLVGHNTSLGTVDHVYVIDTRSDVLDAGIRYNVGTTSSSFTAAGVVHTNSGVLKNVYYSSKVVVNGSYINKFTIQPIVRVNTGTISRLVYDSSVYLLNVTVGTSTYTVATPNANHTGEITSVIKSDASSLNYEDESGSDLWYFYKDDGYPLLLGLEYDNGYYQIENAIDFVFFAKLLSFVTVMNGKSFSTSYYQLKNDIDMSEVASGAYVTPSVNFSGILTGLDPLGVNFSDNKYIYNLHFTTGVIRNNVFYTGLFSILAGTVSDINIAASSIVLTNTETYYSNTFNIGMIAGRNTGGTIQNVQTNSTINLGTAAIGETHVGGIVGLSSGLIKQVSSSGTLNAGTHTFQSGYTITPKYYIGGIVGSATANQLRLESVVNKGAITGFGTDSSPSFSTGNTNYQVKIGGVIGFLLNTSSIKHQMLNVSNIAPITLANVIDTTTPDPTQHVGGVFGELSGNAPVLELNGNYLFANLHNSGNIITTYTTGQAIVRAAGIGINNASEAIEYALLSNSGQFVLNGTLPTISNTLYRYTGTIFDIGSSAVTISRAYNRSNRNFNSPYYNNISPFYYSLSGVNTTIRFSANYGNIIYFNASGITMEEPLTITGITASPNVSLLNVHNYGDISIANVNVSTFAMNVAGLTTILSSGKYIKNSLNQGDIKVAGITGSGSLYISGIVNQNKSGDLHESWQSTTQPRANLGIINTINYGALSSTYVVGETTYYGINGTSNTFAAGITSLNSGSIQDAANLGNITFYNSSTNVSITIDGTTTYAGRITTYTAGISAAGIATVTMSGNARIYDSANNGNIIAIAEKYARAGGILATSLHSEATAGGLNEAIGLVDTIQNSVLSNGLNFGNVSAITSVIAEYSSTPTTQTFIFYYGATQTNGVNMSIDTTAASEQRLAVYSSAGGIIGYGLCVMYRMLNHGTISATDVAGGIVGATYALGSVTTTVKINTAINYGEVKAIPNTSYSSIVSDNTITATDLIAFFMADNNTFIFPTNATRLAPAAKRGFGGVFGRLQRGLSGIMTSEGTGNSFDFIVNANPNIDLIGRLDQVYNFTSTSRFFRFNNAIYYSARQNDTTQLVFTGYFYASSTVTAVSGSGPYNYVSRANTVFRQVGVVSTTHSTPATHFFWRSGTSYANGSTQVVNFAPIDVPWISETELWNSTFTDYVYDENFNMRKDSDSYSFNGSREYTIDSVSGDLKNPSGTTVISSSLLFSSLEDAQAYKVANPSSTPYYYDSENDIRNLSGVRVFAEGNPYTTALRFSYQTVLGNYTSILDSALIQYNKDVNGNINSTTSIFSTTFLFDSYALADSYNTVFNTPAYYNNSSPQAGTRGLWIWNGTSFVRTHGVLVRNDVIFTALAGSGYSDYWLSGGSMFLNSNRTVKTIDSTVLFTTEAAAAAYVIKTLYYYTGTPGSSDIVQYKNISNVYTYYSANTFMKNGDFYVITSGNMVFKIFSAQLHSSVLNAYNYKVANPTINGYFYDSFNNAHLLTLKNQYYLSTNFSISGGNLVDSIGAVVLPAADLDGTPYTIQSSTGNITDSTGLVIYTFIKSLSEYIYYMPNVLLADKFSNAMIDVVVDEEIVQVPNPSYRANGMYVLSTTAGSSYGLVLPANIDTDRIQGILETDLTAPSLLIDYNNVDGSYLNALDEEVITSYNNLKQTKFNEKSALIVSASNYINLEEVGGSSSILTKGSIDDTNKRVTFTISMEAFSIGQTEATFIVSDALLSARALLAVRAFDYFNGTPTQTDLENLRDLLYPERLDNISQNYAPELTVVLPSRSILTNENLSIGYLTVYSEAFIGDDLYAHEAYYTDYEVRIIFTPTIDNTPGTIGITSINYYTVTGATDTDLDYNGSIQFNFTDTKGVLTDGYDFKNFIILKYSDGSTVDMLYYSITSTPTTITSGTGTYSIRFVFSSGVLKTGTYTMHYKYFASQSTYYTQNFVKTASTLKAVSGLNYYSENGSTSIVGTTISSAINFGYNPNITNAFDTVINTEMPTYLSRTTYDPSYMVDSSFVISPFAVLTSITYSGFSYSNGYRSYVVTYLITAENGSTATYTHTITERMVNLTRVEKNNNEVSINQIEASREDDLTTFLIDLGFDQTLDLYNLNASTYPYISISVNPTPVGVTYSVDDYLYLYMNYTTLPNTYNFTLRIYRDADHYVTIATTLVITKLEGTDSYLKDIRFSQLMTGTVYPDINITDEFGVIISTAYDPRVYFAGIDYDGSKDIYHYYRVDGKVTNTPFNQYAPYMLNYLPYGATIAKGTWNGSNWVYGTEVAYGQSIGPLLADFTIDPKTGNDGEAMIPYRVTSEDGNSFTYYYITVTDVTYNVTLLFDIYYCTGEGVNEVCTLAANSSEFTNTLFIISVRNYITDIELQPDTFNPNPALYPVFSEIKYLNNQMTQFYFTNTLGYRYSFGRNLSGFYMFDITLPLDEYMNPLYTYEIEHSDYILDDASDFVLGLLGKYYYIGYAEQNRTRRFNVYIRSITPSSNTPWGLYDFFRSWFD